jgi:polyisoprenoid-binding protein YceI
MTTTNDAATELPTGTWQVDANASELGFGARGMFGLVPVHGHFGDFTGTLTVDADGTRGELRIQATSLDTHNAKRDKHLRSADFFDAEAHPTVTFELTSVKPDTEGVLAVTGVLRIRENALAIETPVTVRPNGHDRLTLATAIDVDRAAAGVGWSKMGMIKGKAHLSAKLTLTKQD